MFYLTPLKLLRMTRLGVYYPPTRQDATMTAPMVKSTHDTATIVKDVDYLCVRIPRRILFKLNSLTFYFCYWYSC